MRCRAAESTSLRSAKKGTGGEDMTVAKNDIIEMEKKIKDLKRSMDMLPVSHLEFETKCHQLLEMIVSLELRVEALEKEVRR